MKKIASLALALMFFSQVIHAAPQRESNSIDAMPKVIYGKTSGGALKPVRVDTDGKLETAGGGGGGFESDQEGNLHFSGLGENIGSKSNVGRWIDFNNSDWPEISGGFYLRSNRYIWIKPTESIDDVIASSHILNGDTLTLSSGATYTVIDDIDFGKGVTLDCNGATIAIATTNKNLFDFLVDNVTVRRCKVVSTAAGSSTTNDIFQSSSSTTFSNINLIDNKVTVASGNGTHRVLQLTNTGGLIDGLEVSVTTANEDAYCGNISANSSANAAMNLDIRDFKCTSNTASSGASDLVHGFNFVESSATNVLTVNMRNGTIEGNELSGTSGAVSAITATAASTADIVVNLYNVRLDAGDGSAGTVDVTQSGTAVVNLRDTVLVNNTTSGTISVNGTIHTNNIAMGGTLTSSATGALGWSVVAGANTACNTTCTSACVGGFASDVTGSNPVGCTDATADNCLCAGAS